MIPTILIPLDGSPGSQSAVGCVTGLPGARRAHALLVCDGEPEEAQRRLDQVADALRAREMTTEALFVTEDLATTRAVRARPVDLVVMAPHRSGDPDREGLGRIAGAVARFCSAPLLLTPPPALGPSGHRSRHQLSAAVLFDGASECEAVLPAIHRLRRWMPMSLRLIGLPEPGDTMALIDLVVRLRALSGPFLATGMDVESWAIPTDDPVGSVQSLVEEGSADVVVLPVQGDWVAGTGSLTPLTQTVLDAVRCPALLVRVESFALPGMAQPVGVSSRYR